VWFLFKPFKATLRPFILHLFNKIVESNIIPPLWKIAKIVPVHNKGRSRSESSNYSPVQKFLSIAKLFEIYFFSGKKVISRLKQSPKYRSLPFIIISLIVTVNSRYKKLY